MGDTETSTGNTFATGVIDLKIDNESYVTNEDGKLVFSTSTSWSLSGLAGKLFFNFLDIKPGDIGEDTISLHVNNNNAWACMEVNLTQTPENGLNEPEALVDNSLGVNDGELQDKLNFAFWADDGDNVYENGETIFKQGLVKNLFNGEMWTLADSQNNIWFNTPGVARPIPGGLTKYIGKAWCFGELDQNLIAQDGLGKTGNNGPLVRGTGFTCDGAKIDNSLQSDGIVADVTFTAVQSRGNDSFKCEVPGNPDPELKKLFFDNFEGSQIGKDFDVSNTSKWTQVGGVRAEWGLDGKVADLNADTNSSGANHTEVLISRSIDMSIYHDITLKYDRKTDDTNAPPIGLQTLTVDYSIDGGTSWSNLETVNGESNWQTKNWSLSPLADNKSNVKIRFTLFGEDGSNHAYIDNVSITGHTP